MRINCFRERGFFAGAVENGRNSVSLDVMSSSNTSKAKPRKIYVSKYIRNFNNVHNHLIRAHLFLNFNKYPLKIATQSCFLNETTIAIFIAKT